MEQTLLLNATYEPLKIVHWQKAITLLCQGKVEVVREYDREVHSVSITFKLTFDHVVPVAQGGRKDWENIVTCCVSCNRKKGGRTPAEAGMHLLRMPKRPQSAPAIRITVGLRSAPESWRDYLYWNVELDDT